MAFVYNQTLTNVTHYSLIIVPCYLLYFPSPWSPAPDPYIFISNLKKI
jgi:hypothetical protein